MRHVGWSRVSILVGECTARNYPDQERTRDHGQAGEGNGGPATGGSERSRESGADRAAEEVTDDKCCVQTAPVLTGQGQKPGLAKHQGGLGGEV